jgi:chromate transporter
VNSRRSGQDPVAEHSGMAAETPLRALAVLFLRLGTTAFGGPAAHIAMMEDEVVRRRGWMSRERFLDLLGATNLIPGPNSTEMAIHVGHAQAGWPGLIVAGTCFILPAVAIVLALAWAYVRFATLPELSALFYGIKPVIIAVMIQALWRLGATAIKTRLHAAVAVAAIVANGLGGNELIVLVGAGVFFTVTQAVRDGRSRAVAAIVGLEHVLPPVGAAVVAGGAGVPFSLVKLFLFFAKVGSVLFGSGYVLLAFLRADLVEHYRWLSEARLLDAIAVGQITPGPLFTTATFIGYLLAGVPGALIATVGIFLPAFCFVAVSGPLVPRLRRWPLAGAFLDGVIVASLALMAVVTWQLAQAAIVDRASLVLAVLSAVVLLRYQINSVWLVLGGAAAGLVLSL